MAHFDSDLFLDDALLGDGCADVDAGAFEGDAREVESAVVGADVIGEIGSRRPILLRHISVQVQLLYLK